MGGHAVFCQKLLNTQHSVGSCANISPVRKWTNLLKESSKKIHWSCKQSLTTLPAGTLIEKGSENTHLAGGSLYGKGPALQKIVLGLFWVPLPLCVCSLWVLQTCIMYDCSLSNDCRETRLPVCNHHSLEAGLRKYFHQSLRNSASEFGNRQ